MRSTLTFIFTALVFSTMLLPGSVCIAQSPHHLLIGNGGVFGPSNYVTLASWEISTGDYAIHDSIPASSVQDLITSGQYAWLAADSFLVKYDLDGYQRLDSVIVPGIRKLAVWQDLIVATRGFGASGNYVQAFQQSDLSPAFSVTGMKGECEGIAVYQDTAYVAVPVGFGSDTNFIAAINLNNGQLLRQIALTGNGLSAGRVLLDSNQIYLVLNSAFGGSTGTIVHHDPSTLATIETSISANIGGGTAIKNGLLYLFVDGNLGSYDLGAQTVANMSLVPGSWAGAAVDTDNLEFFHSETDFFSYGTVKRFNSSGTALDSVQVGISPEALALDSYISTRAAASTENETGIHLWPNPAGNRLSVELENPGRTTLRVLDLMGRDCLLPAQVNRFAELDLSNLADGTYFLKYASGKGQGGEKFIKLSQ